MVELACAEHARLTPSRIDIDRAGLTYSIDTVREVSSDNPGAELFLILGQDAYEGFDSWRDPDSIRDLATLVVVQRAFGSGLGVAVESASGAGDESDAPGAGGATREDCRPAEQASSAASMNSPRAANDVVTVPLQGFDISATDIRGRASRGASIAGLVPDVVAAYIAERGLYR